VNQVAGFDRVTFDPTVMGGRACIRGLRITVALVLNLVANRSCRALNVDQNRFLEFSFYLGIRASLIAFGIGPTLAFRPAIPA
jgi:hypothetical protein